jgi:hypothetical protein
MQEQNENDAEATGRALMALVTDARELAEYAERVCVQVDALAARHGVSGCRPPPTTGRARGGRRRRAGR